MLQTVSFALRRSTIKNTIAFSYAKASRRLYSSSQSIPLESLYSVICLPKCKENLHNLRLHTIWLRDHCPCPECYHSITHQRLLETSKIPNTLAPNVINDLNDSIEIKWNDGHISIYKKAWLKKHAYESVCNPEKLTFSVPPKFWDQNIAKAPPMLSYDEIMRSDKSLYEWLLLIAIYGFAFVRDVPLTLTDSQALAERISFIRETHYGKYWDFTSDLEHNDTAYTSLGLPLHTDTTYFTDPIRLQLFHLLEFKGHGGLSLLLDGFYAAHRLKKECQDAYLALSSIPISSHCTGDENVQIHPLTRYPILNNTSEGEIYQIRYNNNDRMALNHLTFKDVEVFYKSLRKWQAKLTEPFLYTFSLNPGTVLIFDNWRILHGRTAFAGHRRLTGCYLNGDDFCSRLRVLHKKYSAKN